MHNLEFDTATLPWVDRPDFNDTLAARRQSGEISDQQAEHFESWRRDGYLALPGLLDHDLIDRLVEDHERVWTERLDAKALVEGHGVKSLSDLPARQDLGNHHYRLMDIQDVSEVARQVMLHPDIIGFLRFLFDHPVAMQSLFFEYGSEQGVHQDFPYVQAAVLSHLVGCWIACEDVTADNGPLFYYPGSHQLSKFNWGGGSLVFDGKDESKDADFNQWLTHTCTDTGLEKKTFHARKGDVFFWHAALAHGGSPAHDPELTRRSLVVHYSSREGYPRDRRSPESPPKVHQVGEGALYLPSPPSPVGGVKQRIKALARRLLKS